jgi:hypothetical protein
VISGLYLSRIMTISLHTISSINLFSGIVKECKTIRKQSLIEAIVFKILFYFPKIGFEPLTSGSTASFQDEATKLVKYKA